MIDYAIEDKFYIDPTSPSGLRYKVDTYSGKSYKIKMKSVGDVAGCLVNTEGKGYWYVIVEGKYHPAHRVIMELAGFKISDGSEVDHIDGDRSNNNLSNLRVVSRQENMCNKSKYMSNTSGYTGVSWQEKRGKGLYAVAVYQERSGKSRYKYFSVNKYGLLPAFYKACEYRRTIMDKLRSDGTLYSERHGN